MTPAVLCLVAAAVPGGIYPTPAPAGLTRIASYLPDEKCPFGINPDGTARPLGDFALRFGSLGNIANPKPTTEGARKDRQAIQARLTARGNRAATPELAAGIAADQFLLGQYEAAQRTLSPFARSDAPDFRVLVNLAHTYAALGDPGTAVRFHEQAVLGRPGFPKDLPGIKPEQLAWLQTVEKRYYTKWLAIHRGRKTTPDTEEPFPLFGVKFVNDAGVYEPGKLAEEEKKKLPADAIPIVQQLLLWAPWDTSLYWLYAELLAADGSLAEAKAILDQCVDVRQFSNRKILMDHRAALIESLANRAKPAEDEQPTPPSDDGLPPKRTVYIILGIFGPLALLLIVFQVRAYWKRIARRSAAS